MLWEEQAKSKRVCCRCSHLHVEQYMIYSDRQHLRDPELVIAGRTGSGFAFVFERKGKKCYLPERRVGCGKVVDMDSIESNSEMGRARR